MSTHPSRITTKLSRLKTSEWILVKGQLESFFDSIAPILETNETCLHPFLQRINEIAATHCIDEVLDEIYEAFDNIMHDGDKERMEDIFSSASVHINDLKADIIVGLLSASLPVSPEIENRKLFFSLAEAELRKQNEWEADLLSGLE